LQVVFRTHPVVFSRCARGLRGVEGIAKTPYQMASRRVNVGDLLGHVPLPAKITIQVLPPIDLYERFGSRPSLDDAYDHVVAVMQRALDDLAAERRLPIIG
jgi:hypothetical protein